MYIKFKINIILRNINIKKCREIINLYTYTPSKYKI